MISATEAVRRGLILHPSGFYIDVERFKALPNANPDQKIAPRTGEMVLARSAISGWFVGWIDMDTGNNQLACAKSTKEPVFKAVRSEVMTDGSNCLTWYGWGFTNDNLKVRSDIIPSTVLISPARLALEQHRQHLDGILK